MKILALTISLAVTTVTALQGLRSGPVVFHGNLTRRAYADSYLAPFASDDAIETPFELVDDHEDLVQDSRGRIYSLSKRGDDCQKYHKVIRGDNCYTLSLKYTVDMDAILTWNPQINTKCTNLYPGKSYCVRKHSESTLEKACVESYFVKDSDTCITVTKAHGITLDQFYDMNPSVNRGSCDNLLTGGTYCIKEESKAALNKGITHKAAKVSKNSIDKKEKRKLLQKNADLTYYWIAHPEEYSTSGKKVAIKDCDGKKIASVSEDYADALVMEGTGVVGNGIVNLGGCSCSNYECFMEVDKKEDPYGLTSYGSPLRPFITIAANDIKRDTKIFIPSLEGWSIPGSSKKHNGCLLVDDQSWSFEDNHVDFYVYREANYKTLNGKHGVNHVDIYEGGDCNLLDYS
ncbi:carbohydrate-binding module family 50 protein [Backusella circina FSU 941]|nr:carbohydrate-binding module family 50 protein [Backusella circina FSU 941]